MRIVSFDSGESVKRLDHDVFDILSEAGIQNRRIQYGQIAAGVFRNDLPVFFYFITVFTEVVQCGNEKLVTGIQLFDQASESCTIRTRI